MLKIKPSDKSSVSNVSEAVKIIFNPDDSFHVDPITIPDLFKQTVDRFPHTKALMFKEYVTDNNWSGITYHEYYTKVEHMAKIFIKLGLKRRGVVAVLASNCAEWFISEMAAIHAG